jgi:hypothetical protein
MLIALLQGNQLLPSANRTRYLYKTLRHLLMITA